MVTVNNKEHKMTKEFVVDCTDWHGRKDVFFCHARDLDHACSFAYWTLSDLIEIHSIQEYTDAWQDEYEQFTGWKYLKESV